MKDTQIVCPQCQKLEWEGIPPMMTYNEVNQNYKCPSCGKFFFIDTKTGDFEEIRNKNVNFSNRYVKVNHNSKKYHTSLNMPRFIEGNEENEALTDQYPSKEWGGDYEQ